MARIYKWFGGIGYILNFVPYVNFVSPILVAIAWILMGRETREKVFTALGVMLLVLFVGGAAIAVTTLASILAFAPTGPGAGPSAGPGALLGVLITAGVVFLIIALAAVILDILAHFKAAVIFDSKWFKLGGWFRIGAIIAIVVAIPLTIVSALSTGLQGILGQMAPGAFPFGLLFSILWPLIIPAIISFLAAIFSIIAFFTIPEEVSQPESPGLAA